MEANLSPESESIRQVFFLKFFPFSYNAFNGIAGSISDIFEEFGFDDATYGTWKDVPLLRPINRGSKCKASGLVGEYAEE
ncbi:hypothetical protein M3J09_005212 [Ascochyta lentis]